MKVKDIMVKEIKSVSPDISVKEGMEALFKNEISGLPVIDKDGKLVGMFTEKNIISHLLPSYVAQVGRFVYEDDPKWIKKKLTELCNVKVGQLMRKNVVTTQEDASLSEAARIMLTERARRLPVLDKTGKMVGMVARVDVLKAFSGQSVCL